MGRFNRGLPAGFNKPDISGTVELYTTWGPDPFPSYTQLSRDYLNLGTFNVDVGVAGAKATFAAGPGGTSCGVLVPAQLAGAVDQDQYAKFVYETDSAPATNVTRPLLVVFATGIVSEQDNTLNCMGLLIRKEVPDAQLIRGTGYEASFAGGVVNNLIATLAAPALGQTVELQGRIVGGVPELTVLYDDVIVAGTPISDASGFIHGLPGFGSRSSAVVNPNAWSCSAFEAGKLDS